MYTYMFEILFSRDFQIVFFLYIESIGMPAMRSLDEQKFHDEYDQDRDGKLNKVQDTFEVYQAGTRCQKDAVWTLKRDR